MTEKTKEESIDNIISDIRKRADAAEAHGDDCVTSGHAFALLLRSIADRIDVAAARLEADAHLTGAFCEATRKAGNMAKMRAALEAVDALFETVPHIVEGTTVREKVEAALDSPPRNCDLCDDDDDAFAGYHDSLRDGNLVCVRGALRWVFSAANAEKGGDQ